jgi:hypothetical protein
LRATQLLTCDKHEYEHPVISKLVRAVKPLASWEDRKGWQKVGLKTATVNASKLCRLAKGSRSTWPRGSATCRHREEWIRDGLYVAAWQSCKLLRAAAFPL